MRRLLLTACTLLLALSFDATAASRESVDAMFSAMGMGKSWDASLGPVQTALLAFADTPSAASLTPAQRHRVERANARLAQLLGSELGWQSLGAEVSQMYADVFSQPEIDAMAAFYGSPAGQSMITKSPALFGKLMEGGADLKPGDVFTRDEIDAFTAFQHSPAGQSMIAKNALAAERMHRISQAHLRRMEPQVKEIMQEITHPADSEPGPAAPAH